VRFLEIIKSRNGRAIDFDEIKSKIEEVCRRFNLALLYLYSSSASGITSRLGNLDVGFLSAEREFGRDQTLKLLDELQEIFEEEAVDLVDLSRVPLTLIYRVLKEGRCLYTKDPETRIELEARCKFLYCDTHPLCHTSLSQYRKPSYCWIGISKG